MTVTTNFITSAIIRTEHFTLLIALEKLQMEKINQINISTQFIFLICSNLTRALKGQIVRFSDI